MTDVNRGDIILDRFDGVDPWEGVTQDGVDMAHLKLGLAPPGWPTIGEVLKFNPHHDERGRFASADSSPVQSAEWNVQAQDTPRSDRMTPGEFSTPMSDDGYQRHLQHVNEEISLAKKLGGRDTDKVFDHLGGVDGAYLPARAALHEQIISDYLKKISSVPKDRQAIIMAGLGGAGKSTSIRKDAAKKGSVADLIGIKFASYDKDGNGVGDPTNYAILNPDELKEEFARRNMIPKVDHLSPMESSTFAHEESSGLSKILASIVIAKGYNVIWDITAESAKKAMGKGDPLKLKGYDVDGVLVDVPIAQSQASAAFRHRKGQDQWNAGSGYGGRYVPPHLQAGSVDPTGMYNSSNAAGFYDLASRGYYRHAVAIDNTQRPDGTWPGRVKDTWGFKGGKRIRKAVDDGLGEWQEGDYFPSPLYSDAPGTITRLCLDYREGVTTFAQLLDALTRRQYSNVTRVDEQSRTHSSWLDDPEAQPDTWLEVEEAAATGLITRDELTQIRNAALRFRGHV